MKLIFELALRILPFFTIMFGGFYLASLVSGKPWWGYPSVITWCIVLIVSALWGLMGEL